MLNAWAMILPSAVGIFTLVCGWFEVAGVLLFRLAFNIQQK
jgi:hypothetical protein